MFDHDGARYGSLDEAVEAARDELVALEADVARARRRQVKILSWMEGREVVYADGARSLQEWATATLDVSARTSRDLVRAVRLTDSDIYTGDEGAASFDRMVAVAGLVAAGAGPDEIEDSENRDIAGVDNQAALMRRVSRATERQVAERRFLKIEPTMGQTAWRISGIAPAIDGDLIQRALQARGDALVEGTGHETERPDAGQRMLDALTIFAIDYLNPDGASSGEPDSTGAASDSRDGGGRDGDTDETARRRHRGAPLATVTVFVDARLAESNQGERGVSIAAGPRLGPEALERILCGCTVGVVGLDLLGNPTAASDKSRTIPPAVRDFVLRRDGGCVIAGCRSRYRLEPHHIRLRSKGGTHHPGNLVTLCWFHHHVAVHMWGLEIDPDSPPQRRRFLPGSGNRHRAPPWAA